MLNTTLPNVHQAYQSRCITINEIDYEVLARSTFQGCNVVTYAKHVNGEKIIGVLVERRGVAVLA